MSIHYDDKGKFYTDVVSKNEVAVIIQTLTHRMEGSVHIRAGQRLKDELSGAEQFLAVTNATVYRPDGQVKYRCRFMTINRDQIVWAIPVEELEPDAARGKGDG